MINCKGCGMLKIDSKSKCACNIKPKKQDKKPKAIKQVSEKKKERMKNRGSLDTFYKNLAKNHFNEHGAGICQYCLKPFNIKYCLNQRTSFAHILDKGDVFYRHLEVFKNNIAIVCSENCHTSMDSEICRLILKPTLQKLIEKGDKIDVSNLEDYIDN